MPDAHPSVRPFLSCTPAHEPFLPWARIIGEWNEVSAALAEAPRRRVPQLSEDFK